MRPSAVRTLTARWVFPVAGPPLPGGIVAVAEETIIAVGPRGSLTADEDLGNAALIPGLVNAHTHLDLSGAGGAVPPTDPDHFPDWLRGIIAYRRGRSPAQVRADVRAGLAECLRSGTTLIGDIAAEGMSWDALAGSPVRAVVFYELIGLTRDRARRAWAGWLAWLRDHPDTPTCRAGLSPHAPYSVARSLVRLALAAREPVAIHLAESPAEEMLLRDRRGPFRDFLESLGLWQPDRLCRSADEVLRWAARPRPVVFVHGNYLAADTSLAPNQTVCYCPRTHAAFGHVPHPFWAVLAAGGRVCLGTDSRASNPDLDVLAEARFLHARYPEVPGDRLLRMVTLDAAKALGWGTVCGSLEPGKSADLVAVPLPDRDVADPYELLWADYPGVRRTLFRGRWRDNLDLS